MIPQGTLEEIRRRIDIAAVIGEHVSLKKSGRGFIGLCPFHSEKTPSFHVDPERGFFHCFGCNAGGNVFTFVTRTTGVSFPEAVRALAARAGVIVPEARQSEGLERLARANSLAAELFSVILHESRRGEPGREYLRQRALSLETARRFQLGYAPAEGWIEKLVARGVTHDDLRAVGLASVSSGGRGLYGLFRERLVFPIHDLSSSVVAFGGREVGSGRGPKYLNSPETPLYRKGHQLYGLGQARDAVRERGRLLLVEGYMDVLSLVQAGVENVAGVLGTALTVDQLRLARRFADDVVVCFDGDEAGRRAALRAFPLYVDEVDLWPRAVFLPAGEDPDSLARGGGATAVEKVLDRQVTLLDFYLDDLVAGGGADRTARAATRLAELLGRVRDPIVRDKLVRGAAGRLGISEEALLQAARARAAAARPGGAVRPGATQAPRPPGALAGARRFSAEAELVELLLCDAATADRAEREGAIAEIVDAELRRLAERILERRRNAELFDPTELLPELTRPMADRVVRRLSEANAGEETRRAGEEWFERRAGRRDRAERMALVARLRQAEARGDQAATAAALEALRGRSRPQPRAAGARGADLPVDEPPPFGDPGDPDADAGDDDVPSFSRDP